MKIKINGQQLERVQLSGPESGIGGPIVIVAFLSKEMLRDIREPDGALLIEVCDLPPEKARGLVSEFLEEWGRK